jgi:hypothetical protein
MPFRFARLLYFPVLAFDFPTLSTPLYFDLLVVGFVLTARDTNIIIDSDASSTSTAQFSDWNGFSDSDLNSNTQTLNFTT